MEIEHPTNAAYSLHERLTIMIKDRFLLGVVAGTLGNIAKTAVDEISLRMKISQGSFRSTAAGVWLPNKGQAKSAKGQLLGEMLDFGAAMTGGIGMVQLLTATGRDQIIVKGLASGIIYGSAISAALSTLPTNKVRPKDAASNLSYVLSHAVYGLVAATAAAKLGDDTLFTEKSPFSNWKRMVTSNVK